MGFIQEFKKFAIKGNMLDIAVGIIIGAEFGKTVNSLVNDLIMPPVGYIISGIKFSNIKYIIKKARLDENGNVISDAITLNLGNFIQSMINFIIIAFAVFILIKLINRLQKKSEDDPKVPPPKQEQLLEEIRDLLKTEKNI